MRRPGPQGEGTWEQARQQPFPPDGYVVEDVHQANNGRFWWAVALEGRTQRRGILVFDERGFEFFESSEVVGMIAFFLNDIAVLLIKMCGTEFAQTYPAELDIVNVAVQAVHRTVTHEVPGATCDGQLQVTETTAIQTTGKPEEDEKRNTETLRNGALDHLDETTGGM
jgi:hypothetical protein